MLTTTGIRTSVVRFFNPHSAIRSPHFGLVFLGREQPPDRAGEFVGEGLVVAADDHAH